MDIQNVSTVMAQSRIQEEAAVAVQAMTLQTVQNTSEDLARIMESGEMIADPARGNLVDVLI